MVYRQAKSLWLMTEPLGQLAHIRPGLLESNYAGRRCEGILDHEDIAVVVALGRRLRNHSRLGTPYISFTTAPCQVPELHPHTVPRWAGRVFSLGPWRATFFFLATSISEDPTEIELCKLHAMNSTRRGRIHAIPSHPSIHARYRPPSIHPPVLHSNSKEETWTWMGLVDLGARETILHGQSARVLCC